MDRLDLRRFGRLLGLLMIGILGFGMAIPAAATPVAPHQSDPQSTSTTTSLHASISQSTAHAGDQSLILVIEARTIHGELDLDYRGSIDINPSTSVLGLYQSPLQGVPDYTFTAADAGRKVFANWGFATAGQQSIIVIDRADNSRFSTTNSVDVQEVVLHALFETTAAYASDQSLSLIVEARTMSGTLVPTYRGSLDINPSTGVLGLYQSPLQGVADYTFTAADAGRKVFANWGFTTAGEHSITVIDRAAPLRRATSNLVTVAEVFLHASISPTVALAGQPNLVLTIEARDLLGNLVPGYRAPLNINPSASVIGLYQSPLNGIPDYTFTALDAGHKVFNNWGFASNGSPQITIIDRTNPARSVVTNQVFIGATAFRLTFNRTIAVARDRAFTMTLEIVDTQGNRVQGYRGGIDINASTTTIGLPQSAFQAIADYTFTAEDAGIHSFSSWGFLSAGTHSITITDRANPAMTISSPALITTLPPIPSIPQATNPPVVETLPATLPLPPVMAYGWGAPMEMAQYLPSSVWQGYPQETVPSGPGTRYIVTGNVQKGGWEWEYSSYYMAVYLGWENPPADHRESGVGIGYLPHQDPTFNAPTQEDGNLATSTVWLSGWSTYFNNDGVGHLGPGLSEAAGITAQAAHINVHGGGNSGGFAEALATPVEDLSCDGSNRSEVTTVGDPIDTRSGRFFLVEQDLGITTGCEDIDLHFTRSYQRTLLQGGTLGAAWTHNYEQRIHTYGTLVLLQRTGGYALFQDVGNQVYASAPGSHQTLVKRADGGWLVVHRDRRIDVFDATGRLISQQDPNGNQIWLTYEQFAHEQDQGTRLARVDALGGRYLWFAYDYYRPQQLTAVTDHTGRQVRFGYDDYGRLSQVTDPLNQTSTYHYASYHSILDQPQEGGWLLKSKLDPRGNSVFINQYDQRGRVIHQVNNQGQDLTLSYAVVSDTSNLMGATNAAGMNVASPPLLLTTTITDQQNTVTTLIYGSDGLLRKIDDSHGRSTRYTGYTQTRKPTTITNALNQTTTFAYNERGQPIQITNPANQAVFLTYDDWGMLTTITDTVDHAINLTYQGPNLASITTNGGKTIQASYADTHGWKQLLQSINNSGITVNLDYNNAGDLVSLLDSNGYGSQWTHDSLGRVVTAVRPSGVRQTIRYDANDQIVEIKEQPNRRNNNQPIVVRTTSFNYDPAGNLIKITNPRQQVTSFTYDAQNRRISQKLANNATIHFANNPAEGMQSITPPNGFSHQMIQSPLLSQYLPPALDSLAVETNFQYDLLGNLTEIQRPGGLNLSLAYDLLGRTTTITTAQGITSIDYDPISSLPATIIAPDGIISTTYNLNQQPIRTIWSGSINGQLIQAFNLHDQPISQQINQLPPIDYVYDPSGRLSQAGEQVVNYNPQTGLIDSTSLGLIDARWQYNQFGNPQAYTTEWYDKRGLGELNYGTTYTYNALDQITTLTEYRLTSAIAPIQYGYDQIGQLISVSQNGTPIANYTYDLNGNRLTTTTPTSSITATYDSQDRLIRWGSTSYTYTANGERSSQTNGIDTTTYSYDAHGNLLEVSLPNTTTIRYLHDGLNRRIGKQVNGSLVQGWLYADGLNPIAELDSTGNVVAQFIYSVNRYVPNLMIKHGQTYQIITDHLGSPRFVVNADTGAIAQALTYDPWGNLLSDSNPGFQPFGFAGGLYDPNTRLTRFGVRNYDALTGHWTAKDPIGFAGGDPNLYRYVGNDPINQIDPSGKKGFKSFLGKIAWDLLTDFLPKFGNNVFDQLLAKACVDWELAIGDSVKAYMEGKVEDGFIDLFFINLPNGLNKEFLEFAKETYDYADTIYEYSEIAIKNYLLQLQQN
ncbi:RHS repeat-associated core domain-containing protein [Herpetosiphon gulosus]|uniref:RHS repeat-associated core domain-containing protein n=1 Tax=Herpetosiphon gulosus TaxID=1973496 RepID=A0ABP9WXQ8_9CHLR